MACAQLCTQRVGILIGERVLQDVLMSHGAGAKALTHDRWNVRGKQRDRLMPACLPPLCR